MSRSLFSFLRRKQPLIQAPQAHDLQRWATSEWVEYQAWLFHHSFITLQDWQQLRAAALRWADKPLISVVIPVFNTDPAYLHECVYSVQTQAYPFWKVHLVDDGSQNPDTLACLEALTADDPRLHLKRLSNNQGICRATNVGIEQAPGDYVAFLDHDDRLAPDALYYVAEIIRKFPETDIIYTDRDMLSPEGGRFMHLFKPDWSPETLLSGNYLFHLVVYRRRLLETLGGLRTDFEGSQDYDLILRASDLNPKVRHIPKILYHWRQHAQSVALAHNVKEYAYSAGIRALQETLQRRQLAGVVNENTTLWRGNYQVHLQLPATARYQVLYLSENVNYADQVNQVLTENSECDYLIVLQSDVQPLESDSLAQLVTWLQVSGVALTTGKVLDSKRDILHAGLVHRPTGIPLSVYQGYPENTPGYMAVTMNVRNVSSPHPACCAIKRSVWQQLGPLNNEYHSGYTLSDFALRALQTDLRSVYTPFARFIAKEERMIDMWHKADRQVFVRRWQEWLNQGDPYYNPYLTLELADMGINLHWQVPKYEYQISPIV